ncbi:hypothetical protein G7Z17_g1732 [Cylindrodendrum hubeiense]|uniref:Uncharacterized protein n=1 Tax=Cylindrodendrum hubeiense TaxID=595255 RepID=A0A9P5HIV5_9HYPO|nr:hypothetical protein G7Z17_g1732 [Cylindrodendrum hubeiense]
MTPQLLILDRLGSVRGLTDYEERNKLTGWIAEGRLMRPGYGLPVTHRIKRRKERAPYLFGIPEWDWQAPTLTHREVWVLRFIETITNKVEWWNKVADPEIALKWKQEVVGMPGLERQGGFTEKMADACLIELVKKAEIYEKTGLIPVMDYGAYAIKSDSLLDDDLRNALRTAVAELEDVPESHKDWHPGSDGKVLDLVHPSLWPLVYGLSRIISDKLITLDNCLEYCGAGSIIPDPDRPDISDSNLGYQDHSEARAVSERFQWLPCDVNLTGDKPRIESYINNLHPVQHANLYPIIERFIEKSLPAWDIVYRSALEEFDVQRFEELRDITYDCSTPDVCQRWCGSWNRKRLVEQNEEGEDDLDEDEVERLNKEWFEQTHSLKFPEPKTDVDDLVKLSPDDIKTTGFFDDAKQIQVIVKLANIHLTPENPKYDGGSWHVEGQYNEHICATALYYYDSDNITDSHLAFRTEADGDDLTAELNHDQGDFEPIERIFALEAWQSKLQDIGSVLTRQGRALFFPNVYQHRVSPFELVDKTQPGHRKILALFLVDPQVPILSTSNIPPQRHDWWAESLGKVGALDGLPYELREMVQNNVDFPITEKVAKELREELMEERSSVNRYANERLAQQEWSFCEH